MNIQGLSLFTGIGGIDVALSDWVQPVAYCEQDHYCQSVLLQRMQDGLLPTAPIWNDVRTFPYREIPKPQIVFGGFPCQDLSVAGHGKGLEGERSGLFFEIVRLSRELAPEFIFLENVPAITSRGGRRVVGELAALGYDCRWCVISAASVGALHKRDRWFLLAHSNEGQKDDGNSDGEPSVETSESAQTIKCGGEARRGSTGLYRPFESRADWQEVECEFRGIFNGVSHTMDTSEIEVTNAKEERTQKNMSVLWADDEKKKIWETFRRFVQVQKKKILFHVLQFAKSIKRSADNISNWEANQALQEEMLRILQYFREFRDTSQRQKQIQQQFLEFDDAVLILSYFIASSNKRFESKNWEIAMQVLSEACKWTWFVRNAPSPFEKTWKSLSEKEKDWTIMASCFGRWWDEWPDVERAVDEKQPNRLDRLKALGNAVVPQQARQAFAILSGTKDA